jgi:hypothetical protein
MPSSQDPAVRHPAHYTHGGPECWDVMRTITSPESYHEHLRLTAFKYLFRAPFKGHYRQDIAKAHAYLTKLLDVMDAEATAAPSNPGRGAGTSEVACAQAMAELERRLLRNNGRDG